MDPFVGQLALVGFNFAPTQWQIASGQLMSISQNAALFSLLGTMYGGDGRSTFGLPNLQGNIPLGFGQGPGLSYYDQGEVGGTQSVTLLASQTPSHTHSVLAAGGRADQPTPGGNSIGDARDAGSLFAAVAPTTAMNSGAISPFTGGSQPHNNMMSFLAMNWIIALTGVFPARS